MLALIRVEAVLLHKFDRVSLSTRIRESISELCFRVFQHSGKKENFGIDPTTIDRLASEQD